MSCKETTSDIQNITIVMCPKAVFNPPPPLIFQLYINNIWNVVNIQRL